LEELNNNNSSNLILPSTPIFNIYKICNLVKNEMNNNIKMKRTIEKENDGLQLVEKGLLLLEQINKHLN
jgi:hypothetical protein